MTMDISDETEVNSVVESVDITPNLDGGVLKKVLKYGDGVSTPTNGCKVSVHYTGKLTDGTVFDSSREREVFEFNLGKGNVIKAWDIGVATMKWGEIAEFTCQPEYAYGTAGSPPLIPPNAVLIFEIEMISWKAEDLSPRRDGGVLRTILRVGEGFSYPNDGAIVDIHITGEYMGNVFEDRDVTFPLGEGSEYNICPGVEKALEKFKKREKSRLEIKSKYGFGAEGKPEYDIPPHTDLVYTVRLINFEKQKEKWSLSCSEKLEQGKFFKEKGTYYFKENKYTLAIKMYKKGSEFVEHEVGFSDDEEKERNQLNIAINLNLALCYLKIKDYITSKDACNTVLETDQSNEKAYFRRGQVYMELGEPELAKNDFEKVLSLDSTNKAVIRNIVSCNELLKHQRAREKTIYANMFEKFAKHDKEKEEEERKQQPDVMKTLGEWAEEEREREPTEFEKENPNILMLDGTGDFKNM